MSVKIIGYKELQNAIKRNPAVVVREARNYFIRAIAEYRRVVTNSPWHIGSSGGGAPVDTGNLVGAHGTSFKKFSASYGIKRGVNYAKYVHGNKPYQVKVKGKNLYTRPWLNYAIQQKENKVKSLQDKMLQKIVKDLGK